MSSVQLDCRGSVWSTGLEGMKLSRVLDAGQGLCPWVNGATEDSSKLGLCLKGLAIWDAAPSTGALGEAGASVTWDLGGAPQARLGSGPGLPG